MPRALVTGANGHIGAHLCRQLLAAGYEVVAFVRKTSDTTGIDGLDVEIRHGDVLDRDSLIEGAAGCDVMFHLAAVYEMWAKDAESIMRPAVEGTRNAFAAAQAAGIERVVYTSSIVSIGYSYSPDTLRTEQDWNDDASSAYYRAKTESERVAQRLAKEAGVELVVVCPGGVLGPLDYRVTPSTAIVQGFVNGTQPSWPGGLNLVTAADVARVHVLAAEKGVPGGRYLAVGANRTSREWAELVTKLTGRKVMHLPLPRWLQHLLSYLMVFFARLMGTKPMADPGTVRDVVGRWGYFDDSHTRQALGFEPGDPEEMVRETVAWCLHIGAVKPAVAAGLKGFDADAAWLPPKKAAPALPG